MATGRQYDPGVRKCLGQVRKEHILLSVLLPCLCVQIEPFWKTLLKVDV